MFHKHSYIENEALRIESITWIKFVFKCSKCGHIKNKVVGATTNNDKFDFEV